VTQARRPNKAYKIIGVTFCVFGFILQQMVFIKFVFNQHNAMDMVVYGPLAILMTFGGAFLFWRGSQYAAEANAEKIVTDASPDVLYLRAFRSDPSTKGYVFRLMFGGLIMGMSTEEQQLDEVLRPFGDLVAIGQPGEDLPKPGAARICASDEEWKEVVKRQMRAARLVVIRAGVGENLLWELKQAVETSSPEKVLILVLNMKAKHYEFFRMKVTQVLSVSLPPGTTLRWYFGRVSGFVRFATDWKPNVLPLPRLSYLRVSAFKPLRQQFKFALRPVFESFGLEWQPPPSLLWLNVIIKVVSLQCLILGCYFLFRFYSGSWR
jgi:hypothetical protein